MGLSPLASLSTLGTIAKTIADPTSAAADTGAATAANPGALASLSTLGTIAKTIADPTSAAADTGAAIAANPSAITSPITKYVVIGLGFILVAAGIFSFDKTREFVVNTGKEVGKAAITAGETAAAAA